MYRSPFGHLFLLVVKVGDVILPACGWNYPMVTHLTNFVVMTRHALDMIQSLSCWVNVIFLKQVQVQPGKFSYNMDTYQPSLYAAVFPLVAVYFASWTPITNQGYSYTPYYHSSDYVKLWKYVHSLKKNSP